MSIFKLLKTISTTLNVLLALLDKDGFGFKKK